MDLKRGIKMGKYFKVFTDKNPITYAVGEEIAFTVFAREDGENIDCGDVKWVLQGDDGNKISGNATIDKTTPLTVTYTLKRAGFVHLNVIALRSNGEKNEEFEPLDSSAGADVSKITYSDTLPYDFEKFWAGVKKTVDDFPINVVYLKNIEASIPDGFKAYEVRIETPSKRTAAGYVTVPIKAGKYPIKISFLGYGLHAAHCVFEPDKICGCFNAHGFENDIPYNEIEAIYGQELKDYGFSQHENASNHTTYFKGMMIRNLMALKYLKSLPEWDGKNIISEGGSQGALQAITLAAQDSDVTEVISFKPWLCDLNSENNGYMGGWRPTYAEGLRYYDTVAQGMQLKCPISIECYLGDYCCPPKTVMALYNSIKSEKKIKFIQSARHSYFPPEDETVEAVF